MHHIVRNIVLLAFSLLSCLRVNATSNDIDPLIRQAVEASVQRNYRESYKLLFQARQKAQEQNEPQKLFWILTNLGINLAEQYNYTSALSYFNQAQRIAKEHLGKRQELSIRNNIAGVYMLDNQVEKALTEYLNIYQNIDEKAKNRAFRGGCALNIANIYIEQGDTVRARPFMYESMRCLEHSAPDSVSLLVMRINYQLAANHPQEAYRLTTLSLKKYPQNSDFLYLLARTTLALHFPDKAEQLIASLLQSTTDAAQRRDLLELMSTALSQQQKWPEALAYKDSATNATRDIYVNESQAQYEGQQMQFEMMQQQQEINNLNNRHKRNIILLMLCLVALAASLWALLTQIHARRKQRKIAELENQQQVEREERLQKELETQQKNAEQERLRAKLAIEQRSRELISKALITANKNNQLRSLLNQLVKTDETNHAASPAQQKSIANIQKQLDSTEEWRDFTTYFEQVNVAFINKLHELHPTLSANEIRYLSLLSINLSRKEISLLLNITPEYCKKKKQQIAHKMGLDDTRELYAYLTRLALSTNGNVVQMNPKDS